MSTNDNHDKHDVASGAAKLAVTTVIRALVEHASVTAPGLRDRITGEIEAYLERLGPQSDLERDFAERARASAAVLMEPLPPVSPA